MLLKPDFVVVTSYVLDNGLSKMDQYDLSSFQQTDARTAYGCLKDTVLSDLKNKSVNWISVNIVIGDRLISSMQGSLEWFKSVEYFKKLIGSMGGSMDVEPVSYGFIDQKHNIRVELENGAVLISEL